MVLGSRTRHARRSSFLARHARRSSMNTRSTKSIEHYSRHARRVEPVEHGIGSRAWYYRTKVVLISGLPHLGS